MKRRLVVAALLVAVPAAAYGGFRLLRSLSFFEVRRIELVGGQYLHAADMARAMAVPRHTSIFDPTAAFLRRAAAVDGVLHAEVSRRLPGTLRVTITEAEPVALVEKGRRLLLVDGAGHPLPFDPTLPASDLPIAEADSAVAGLLARARELGPQVFGRIERAGLVRRDVRLDLERGRLILRAGAPVDDLRNLFLVADLLLQQGRSWDELDGRFLPHVIVRGGGKA